MELLVLMLVAYAAGFGVGWMIWGRNDMGRGEDG